VRYEGLVFMVRRVIMEGVAVVVIIGMFPGQVLSSIVEGCCLPREQKEGLVWKS
jgi:hypothetical protein